MNILETIVERKKQEVKEKKSVLSIDALKSSNKDFERDFISLKEKLFNGKPNIIAEFKRKSPSKGWINQGINVTEVISAYEKNSAAAISVLTDKDFFGGDMEELKVARLRVDIPLLRKDFMIDEYQLYEAKSCGADLILLIAACLTKQQTKQLAAKAKELKLEVLLEVHSKEELDFICDDIDIIGINNRNLETFVTDIQTSADLLPHLPADKPAISESGINDVETIINLHNLGFKGFLIGEAFMKAAKPPIAFADFMKQLKAKFK